MPQYFPNRKSMTMAQRKRSAFIKSRLAKRPVFAVNKIIRAYRNYRYRKPFLRTRRLLGAQTCTVKTRVCKDVRYRDMRPMSTEPGMYFVVYFAPWRNVSTSFPIVSSPPVSGDGTCNLFYSANLEKQMPSTTQPRFYNQFRLSGVYMKIRRPKTFLDHASEAPTSFYDRTSSLWGSEILHTKQVTVADSTTGVVQPILANLQQERTIEFPASFSEAVDDGNRFKITSGGYQKRIWKPVGIEKRWRLNSETSELDHSTGGIYVAMRDQIPVPQVTGPTWKADQVMFTIVADIYMQFKQSI